MKKLFVLFLLIFPFIVKAQFIKGKVVDVNGDHISFANVVLCQDIDSTVISGCTSGSDGLFALECSDKEGKHLRVSFVGYETATVKIEDSPMTIVLKPVVMDEVVVKGHKQLYKLQGGEVVANVKGTVLENFPGVSAIIAQLPFVSEQDGVFTVFGKGTPLIYINNRLVRDKGELRGLVPSQIKSIKVNMMPGAKYDASVNSVIQIITERPQGEGLSGSLYGGATRSREWSTSEYVSLNYRNEAWDVFGSAYWTQNRQKIDMDSYQRLLVSESLYDITYDEVEGIKTNSLATVAGVNYNPNINHSTGLQYTYYDTKWKDDMFDRINYTIAGNADTIEQTSYFDAPGERHNVNAYYNGMWNDKFTLNLNVDWMTGDETNEMNSSFADGYAEDINTISTRKYNLYAARGVFSYTGSKWFSVDAGTEYAYTDVTQIYNIDNEDAGIDNSDDVTKQNRWAMFISAKARAGKWGVGAELRYENIDFDYYRNGEYNREQSKSYSKLFPSVKANYSGKDIQAVLGYERKIQYPSYGQLRSNVQYSSPFAYESGNPLLQPQIQNDFTGMLTYKKIMVMLGYTIYEDYIAQLMSLYNGEPIVLMKTENVRDIKGSFFAINYTPVIGCWRPNFEIGGRWQFFNLNDGQDYDKPVFSTRWNNTLSLPKDWMINLDARWQSEGHSGIYLMKSSWSVNTFVTKQLFARKLSVSLVCNDIFKSGKKQWRINNDFMVFDYDRYNDTRSVQLTVSYSFNTTRSKYKGTSSSDEIRRL